MPNCFQLLDKETKQPVPLNTVDNLICRDVLHVTPHSEYYGGDLFNWYDSIGFQIAMGKPLGSQELKDYFLSKTDSFWVSQRPVISEIIAHLESRYVSVAFSQ